jgi:hypothetical protein
VNRVLKGESGTHPSTAQYALRTRVRYSARLSEPVELLTEDEQLNVKMYHRAKAFWQKMEEVGGLVGWVRRSFETVAACSSRKSMDQVNSCGELLI